MAMVSNREQLQVYLDKCVGLFTDCSYQFPHKGAFVLTGTGSVMSFLLCTA